LKQALIKRFCRPGAGCVVDADEDTDPSKAAATAAIPKGSDMADLSAPDVADWVDRAGAADAGAAQIKDASAIDARDSETTLRGFVAIDTASR
jgi:hypothetical protein